MTALYLVGDVFERVADLRARGIRAALALCSPPFLALRSYLPDGHPLKAREIGSEATPAAFIDVMLALVAEVAHVLEPWGSIAWELGDTYSGSGGAGGDHDPEGGRFGPTAFAGSAKARRTAGDYPVRDDNPRPDRPGRAVGWPDDKSLAGIPQAFMLSLAYGYNVLDRAGPDSPAGRWRVRNLKPWIRSNPPVGALGDKERPATSYVIVATRAADRYFDLDAVRTAAAHRDPYDYSGDQKDKRDGGGSAHGVMQQRVTSNAAGAPPRDWWHHVDAVLDACLDDMAGKVDNYERRTNGTKVDGRDGVPRFDSRPAPGATGARGVHLRRRLEAAGILATVDAIDVSPKGYKGAHYAVWPPELVRRLVLEMCPRRVCTTCGQPSRRLVEAEASPLAPEDRVQRGNGDAGRSSVRPNGKTHIGIERRATTVGWTDCGCPGDHWRPGLVLDPFVGSGTTLAVCSGLGRDSIGIDLDYTNVGLALERVGGLFLAVEWPEPDLELLRTRALGPGSPHPASYDRWPTDDRRRWRAVAELRDEPGCAPRARDGQVSAQAGGDGCAPRARKGRAVPAMAGQLDILST